MFIIYDLIFLIFVLIYLPVYLFKGKFHRGFLTRLGILPDGLNLDRPIWIHAVSVGEAVSIKGLVAGLREAYPHKKLVISTVTATGNKIAQGLINAGDLLIYLPFDFSFIVRSVLGRINPCLFIIAETEIWPNLISRLYKQKIPIVTVNGRISDSSYAGYSAIKLFIRPILRKVNIFLVQSDTDAERLQRLGADKENIRVTGNVKFDINLKIAAGLNVSDCRKKLWVGLEDELGNDGLASDSQSHRTEGRGLASDSQSHRTEGRGLASDSQSHKLLVCGSTHAGEEELIIKTYKELLLVLPGLKLVIAPRHPERSEAIAAVAAKNGFMPIFISNIVGFPPAGITNPIFILDSIGQLINYYSCADIVFVGGSLVKAGGHNILEPASLKKPVIFGPHMFNFRDIADLFLKNKAGIMVADAQGLGLKIKEVLSSSFLARELGERAYELIIKNSGATQKNIGIIKRIKIYPDKLISS